MTDRPTAPVPFTTEDTVFGAITVDLRGQQRVTVSGERIPTVVLTRDPAGDPDGKPNGEPDPQIAIGTRDAERLTLTVDGAPVPLRPGRGRFLRGSYRVEVSHRGAVYVLVPDSIPSSRLTRDGRRLGDFSCDGDQIVIADWREDADARPADAAIGYALAAAFGTGGHPTWMLLVEGVAALIP
ncbi:hypothetical protein ABTZ03_14740 [Kitasatospora sp. NPDC096077]|uniref:hypothetical protein n=1 Tax=Kitasatospora sp. NPDC096077 TaxID=3155544 RepID=UPI0033280B6F